MNWNNVGYDTLVDCFLQFYLLAKNIFTEYDDLDIGYHELYLSIKNGHYFFYKGDTTVE